MTDKTPLEPAVVTSNVRRREGGPTGPVFSAATIAVLAMAVLLLGTVALAVFSMEAY